jgi:hypothetical protein
VEEGIYNKLYEQLSSKETGNQNAAALKVQNYVSSHSERWEQMDEDTVENKFGCVKG